MSELVSSYLVKLPNGEPCFRIEMKAPRANALEPELLTALHSAFDGLERSGAQKALISGGRNFSSGGDVGRFYAAAQSNDVADYTENVVPVLQSLVLRMIKLPVSIATAIRGAATGGSAGLVFASDIVVAAPDAFVQPYYGDVGFAPDGGWLATLPELIGGAPARGWIMSNKRVGASELERMGLAQDVSADTEARALELLNAIEAGTALAAKTLFWDGVRLATVKARLSAEAEQFRTLITRQATLAGMQKFLQPNG